MKTIMVGITATSPTFTDDPARKQEIVMDVAGLLEGINELEGARLIAKEFGMFWCVLVIQIPDDQDAGAYVTEHIRSMTGVSDAIWSEAIWISTEGMALGSTHEQRIGETGADGLPAGAPRPGSEPGNLGDFGGAERVPLPQEWP